MNFSQTSDGIYIDQSQYVACKLTQYGINEWGSLEKDFQLMLDNDDSDREYVFPYRSAVGSLIHLMRGTRPDIAEAVSVLSRYLNRPTTLHCHIVKRVYRYFMANRRVGLHYKSNLDCQQSS